LIEIGLLVLEKKIFKNFQLILIFCYYLPLEKGNPLYFNNLKSPPPKDDLSQVWLKLAQRFWRRSQNVKVYRQTDRRTTDNGRSE
jgi:hypothetical protein